MAITDYRYKVNKAGYEIYYKDELIAGRSVNVSFAEILDYRNIEFHREEAKKELKQIIDNERKRKF